MRTGEPLIYDRLMVNGDGDREPRVEFLWWEGCPSWERALSELRAEMDAIGLDSGAVELREVRTDEQADGLAFAGSPTIRVEGTDVQEPGSQPTGLTCRVYKLRDGRISALPDPDDVRDALQQAKKGASDE